jgi:hypothetical protein
MVFIYLFGIVFIYIRNFNLISILLFKNSNNRLILLVRQVLNTIYFSIQNFISRTNINKNI